MTTITPLVSTLMLIYVLNLLVVSYFIAFKPFNKNIEEIKGVEEMSERDRKLTLASIAILALLGIILIFISSFNLLWLPPLLFIYLFIQPPDN